MDATRPPRQAAAVILARDGVDDLELFMVRRPPDAGSFANVWVFPGGTVGGDDVLPLPGETLSGDQALRRMTERGGVPPADVLAALALHRAGLRELLEEAGVLLARSAPDRDHVLALRAARRAGASLDVVLADAGLSADLGGLVYFSHWITPAERPRRFDTRFFVAMMPAGQEASCCRDETRDGTWVSPREALGRYAAGDFPLVLPTRMHLQRLTPYRLTSHLLADAVSKPIRTVLPGRPHDAVDDDLWWREGQSW